MITEIRIATLGVRDLAASRRFYEVVFDYVVQASGTVSGPAFQQLWQLPEGGSGEVLVMGPESATSGLVRLVEFDRPGELYWGSYAAMQDYGHYALNMRVPEIRAAMAAIRGNGGKAKSEPTHWTVMPTLSAWDSLSYDVDDIILDVFQLEPAPGSVLSDYDGRPSSLQTVAIHSSDARRSASFYAALGFRPLYDKMLENMESFFQLPPGTNLHNINMMMPSAPEVGRLEIAQYVGWPGSSQRARAVPPALGILSISLETDALEATAARRPRLGGAPGGGPGAGGVPGRGAVVARSYFGPDDEAIEVFQRA